MSQVASTIPAALATIGMTSLPVFEVPVLAPTPKAAFSIHLGCGIWNSFLGCDDLAQAGALFCILLDFFFFDVWKTSRFVMHHIYIFRQICKVVWHEGEEREEGCTGEGDTSLTKHFGSVFSCTDKFFSFQNIFLVSNSYKIHL